MNLLENERRYISRTQNYKKVVSKQPKINAKKVKPNSKNRSKFDNSFNLMVKELGIKSKVLKIV